ncbi:MAG: ABC transporter ATP-binding protein [Stenotrophomonas acidaminiphila]|nr:MAG: ABC transporter ATP-binding protein [Stenotrophomonas acidaminiphila]
MSSEGLAIRAEALAKFFPIYEKPQHRLMQMFTPAQWKHRWFQRFDALRGVSFEIRRGETFGVIGRNGSGKSTLLQLLCGILTPSGGQVEVNGRIAALLELGAGFNSEFTGRENVYLYASLLGLDRETTDARFGDIERFADIGEFIDQPVRTYSSGMYVRLAFAVAINVDPDILVIDEALSVGDEAFQRKCFARIEALKRSGATIVFVSHSAGVVLELCDRAILLDGGQLLALGNPRHVVSRYHKLLYASADARAAIRDAMLVEGGAGERIEGSPTLAAPNAEMMDAHLVAAARRGSRELPEAYFDPALVSVSAVEYESAGARISAVRVCNADGDRVNVLRPGDDYLYRYQVAFSSHAAAVRFGMMIKTIGGIELGGGVSSVLGDASPNMDPGDRIDVSFRFRCLLAPGVYFLNAGVVASGMGEEERYLHRLVDAIPIRVMHDVDALATGIVNFIQGAEVVRDKRRGES